MTVTVRFEVCLAFAVAMGLSSYGNAGYVDVPNADFEAGTTFQQPPSWYVWAGAGVSKELYSYMHPLYPRTGKGFGRLRMPGDQVDKWSYVYSAMLDVGPISEATMNGYFRSNMKRLTMRIWEYDANGVFLAASASGEITPNWSWNEFRAHHGSFTVDVHANTRKVRVGFFAKTHNGSADNYVDVDDITLVVDPPTCADECHAGQTVNGNECRLYNATTQQFESSIPDGPGNLHNRARNHTSWLRDKLVNPDITTNWREISFGVAPAHFTSSTYDTVNSYYQTKDIAINTGAYLAAEAYRYMVTGAPDAHDQIDALVRTFDKWWRISGDPGYLARVAAPTTAPQQILDIFSSQEEEDHLNVWFEGESWHWKGGITRDQYQGAIFGMSLAYDATDDEAIKEIIRARVVEFVEQLMVDDEYELDIIVDGDKVGSRYIDLAHCVFTDDQGDLAIVVDTDDMENAHFNGLQCFTPNMGDIVSQLPFPLSLLDDIPLRTQAIQLGGMFMVALQVTYNVPAYATRRSAILSHYNSYFSEWYDMADGWEDTSNCASGYHGKNIAHLPLYNWISLESTNKWHLQYDVLETRTWPAVWDHKNVLFAFITASQARAGWNVQYIIDSHVTQLQGFPTAPYNAPAQNNYGEYTEDPSCSGNATVAIDVEDRLHDNFMWETQPFKLHTSGYANYLYPAHDYLLAYWMGRYYGYISEDSANKCLLFD